MKGQKTVQANYSQELIELLVTEYNALIVEHKGDNKAVLALLSAKHGKSVASLRAKLASLKVYVTANSVDAPTVVSGKAIKKEEIAAAISAIVGGGELVGLEAATKAALQSILVYLLKVSKLLEEKEDKINDLIGDMLEDSEHA